MNISVFFPMILLLFITGNCFAQNDVSMNDDMSLIEEVSSEDCGDVSTREACPAQHLPPSSLYTCEMSSHLYQNTRVTYSGCLCTYRAGNTLYVGFKLTSHPSFHAQALVRPKPWGAPVADGPQVTNGYSYTSYTTSNVWNYFGAWDAPYQGN